MPNRRVPSLPFLAIVMVAAVLAPGCRAGHAASAPSAVGTDFPLPPWIGRVVPAPGTGDGGVHAVEVRDKLTPPEYSRLIIDGVDVTAYARKAPGLLHYDSGTGPVVLRPGDHFGRVDRMHPNGAYAETMIASFVWPFRSE